jgi:phosphatidylserine decarboxylase
VQLQLDTTRAALRLEKGDEMGRFNMGSTVILITAPDMIDWLANMKAGNSVSVGQPLARLRGRMMAYG